MSIVWPDPRVRAYDPADTLAKTEKEHDNSVDMDNRLLESGQALATSVTGLTGRVDEIESKWYGTKAGLAVAMNPLAPDTQVLISADALATDDHAALMTDLDVTLDVTGDGAGGLDADDGGIGSLTSTWIYIYAIHDSSDNNPATDAAFASTSLAPTLPGDYDKKRLVGAIYVDEDGDLLWTTFRPETGLHLLMPHDAADANWGSVDLSALGTSWGDVSFAGLVPPGTRLVRMHLHFWSATSNDAIFLRPKGSSADRDISGSFQQAFTVGASSSGYRTHHYLEIELDDDLACEGSIPSTSNLQDVEFTLLGFYYDI